MSKIGRKQQEKNESIACGANHDSSRKCHWIIVKDDFKSIYGYPMKTRDECLAEISFNNLSGYHLEHKFNNN